MTDHPENWRHSRIGSPFGANLNNPETAIVAARLGQALFILGTVWASGIAWLYANYGDADFPYADRVIIILTPFFLSSLLCYVLGGFSGSKK